jgi:hypothetical protein
MKSLHGEGGQILVVAALLALGLIGMVGLVIDGGYIASQRRQGQNAADSAALAAARALFEGRSVSVAEAIGLEYAEANGFDTLDGNTVDVNIPPESGNHIGDSDYAEVIVRRTSATFFIHALIPGELGVQARGVAGIAPFPEDYAIIALNPTDCRSFDQGGSSSLTVTGGGIMVNSTCSNNAMNKGGSGYLTVDGRIDVHGGYDDNGSGTVSPDPNEDVPWTVDDPLALLPVPALGAPAPGSPGTAASPSTWKFTSPGTYSLQPGTYYGGLDINCSGCTITLAPGMYIMAGGGFSKQSNPNISGTDVTIYLTDCNGPTNTTSCSGDGRAKPLLLSGGGTFELDPPDSGPYQGITFWQDRLITDDASVSGSNSAVQGIFYVPGARIDLGGGTDLGVVQIVADRVNFSGSTAIDLEYGGFRQFEKPDVVLVE